MRDAILLTGATGLVGSRVLRILLADGASRRASGPIFVLVRDLRGWLARAAVAGFDDPRVHPIVGDLTRPGLALAAADRRRVVAAIGAVLHAAADTCFSR